MKTPIRKIVVVSDLHVGDQLALWPDTGNWENDHAPTRPVRDFIRAAWFDFTDKWIPHVTGGEPFVLVVNGDAVQGNWSRFGPLMDKSMIRQYKAACVLLAPLVTLANRVVFVEGTEIHTGDDERLIAETMNEIAPGKIVKTAGDEHVHTHARIEMNGLNHVFRHHTGVAGRAWTEASNQANHLSDDRLRRMRVGHKPTDVLVTAHRHTYGYTSTLDGCSIVTLAWQAVGRFVRKVTREDVGSIGAAMIDYSNCDYREHPHVRNFVRSWPEAKALQV